MVSAARISKRILPFLDRRPEAVAIMQHLINMMPPTLVTIHKRNLEKEFKTNGQVDFAPCLPLVQLSKVSRTK